MGSTGKVGELLSGVRISSVWCALGGSPPRRGRAGAFWRKADGLNVSLSNEKSCWYDFARGEGGGILDLIEKARGCDRKSALRWLAASCGVSLDDRPLTPVERVRWARARRGARPLAQAALWWWRERMGQLEEQKVVAVQGDHLDIGRLAPAARELYRLQSLSPDAVVEYYLYARAVDPHATRQLVRLGETWERVCKAVILACLTKPETEGQRAA